MTSLITWSCALAVATAGLGCRKEPRAGNADPVEPAPVVVHAEPAPLPLVIDADAAVALPIPPPAVGDDRANIAHGVKGSKAKIQFCYEKELLAKPNLAGKVIVEFTIEADGTVDNPSASTGMDPAVEACIVEVFKGMRFPAPSGGSKVKVRFPFIFQQAGP